MLGISDYLKTPVPSAESFDCDILSTMEKFQDRFLEEVKEKFNRLGIKAVLFDFDDTLIFTSEKFAKYMEAYASKVAEEMGVEEGLVIESLRRLNDEEYKRMGVNPARWEAVLKKMALEFEGNEQTVLENLDILMKIYSEEPRIRPGAEAVLEIVKRCGIKIGLVTHANEDWTNMKLNSTGMSEYFDLIYVADENKHKSAADWVKCMVGLEVLPEECLVVGDSLPGDIIPAAEIGAKTMWLHNGSSWSVYKAGKVPEGTVHLDNVNELLSALGRLR